MILAPATRDLLERLMLTGPVRITASETDALQSLRTLGLAEEVARRGSFCATARGSDLLRTLVRCEDLENLKGANTAFGVVVALALRPNRSVRLTFSREGRLLDIELPDDCWIGVLP